MSFQTFVFYAFSAVLVFAGLRVITTRNPVHAALWLVLSFFSAAGVWLLLQAEFLAIALTHRRRRETKYQNPTDQVRVHRNDRLRVLNIPAEKREP